MLAISVELINEYTKEKVWEENNTILSIYIVSDFCLCVCIHFLLPKILVFDIQDSI